MCGITTYLEKPEPIRIGLFDKVVARNVFRFRCQGDTPDTADRFLIRDVLLQLTMAVR